MVREIIISIMSAEKHYWFKRKTYGWGWTPANWQGWISTLTFIFAIIGYRQVFNFTGIALSQTNFLCYVAGWTIALIALCFLKGEKPKWQWGKDKDD